jgi:hypothetical protein
VSDRPTVAAAQKDQASPLAELPGLYDQLMKAVRVRHVSGVLSDFGAAVPLRVDVLARLYSSDHVGRLGVVPGLQSLERITRLALGDTLPGRADESVALRRACIYLTVQFDRLLTHGSWTPAAAWAVADLVDQVLSRVDVWAVNLDWQQMVKRAKKRIETIDATILDDAQNAQDLAAEKAECKAMVEMDYIDYEGELFDVITERFMAASTNAYGWHGFVAAETARMVTTAKSLLGIAEHSRRRVALCPMSCGGKVGLSFDPDVADCDVCSWTSTISDGHADAWFRAFRESGWRTDLLEEVEEPKGPRAHVPA